jgi:hypothetical protein
MNIRDASEAAQWAQLNGALGDREPRFVERKSLPRNTLAWEHQRLPMVLVSSDVFEDLRAQIPKSFAAHVLLPIRMRCVP